MYLKIFEKEIGNVVQYEYYEPVTPIEPTAPKPNMYSNGKLIFPQLSLKDEELNLEGNNVKVYDSSESNFWSTIDQKVGDSWTGAYITALADNSEQTVINITGQGVLANVITACPSVADSTFTVKVTVDGYEKVFTSNAIGENTRFVLGHLNNQRTTESNGRSKRSGKTFGNTWNTDANRILVTPDEAVTDFRKGIKFEESLVVTVQCDNSVVTSNFLNRAGVTYLTYIPEGF